jgi:PPOX class probable F420-dependent enzyme
MEVGAVTRDEAVALAKSARVGRLATVRPDGRPHVVPFVFALIEGGSGIRVYWAVDDKRKRSRLLQRIENIQQNEAVEFVVDRYAEDWSQLWWVRASGTARVVSQASERAEGLAALADKYPGYAAAPPAGPVVCIDVETIGGWRAMPDPE